jgi:hypothetical protein
MTAPITFSSRILFLARIVPVLVLVLVASVPLLTGCTSVKRSLKMKNAYDVRSEGRSELESRVRQHVDAFLARPEIKTKGLKFNGDIVVRTVAVDKKDRLGVPYWTEKTSGRVGGITLFTGSHLPVVIAVATYNGRWDERTLRHECAHAVLLWNDIKGHPREYRNFVPLWY